VDKCWRAEESSSAVEMASESGYALWSMYCRIAGVISEVDIVERTGHGFEGCVEGSCRERVG
jgi:hypothetical protein